MLEHFLLAKLAIGAVSSSRLQLDEAMQYMPQRVQQFRNTADLVFAHAALDWRYSVSSDYCYFPLHSKETRKSCEVLSKLLDRYG